MEVISIVFPAFAVKMKNKKFLLQKISIATVILTKKNLRKSAKNSLGLIHGTWKCPKLHKRVRNEVKLGIKFEIL